MQGGLQNGSNATLHLRCVECVRHAVPIQTPFGSKLSLDRGRPYSSTVCFTAEDCAGTECEMGEMLMR